MHDKINYVDHLYNLSFVNHEDEKYYKDNEYYTENSNFDIVVLDENYETYKKFSLIPLSNERIKSLSKTTEQLDEEFDFIDINWQEKNNKDDDENDFEIIHGEQQKTNSWGITTFFRRVAGEVVIGIEDTGKKIKNFTKNTKEAVGKYVEEKNTEIKDAINIISYEANDLFGKSFIKKSNLLFVEQNLS